MKKNIIPFMAALMLPLGCTKIETPSSVPEGDEGILLTISASSSPVTRAELNEDNSVSFQETDALSVFCRLTEDDLVSYVNNKFSVSRLYDDGSADFQGTVASAEGLLPVMYPYQEGATIEKYNKVDKLFFNVPTVQKAVPGTFDPDAAISVGMAVVGEDSNVSVSLSNACALVKFAVPPGDYSKVTLIADGCRISGPCAANVTSEIGGITPFMSEENTVSLKGDITGGNIYLLAVVPGEATKGITVKLFDKEGNVAGEKSTVNSVTFTAGHILNIGLLPTFNPTWEGSGTKSDPYCISTSAHLKLLAQAFSLRETAKPYAGKYFLQKADINMNGEEITIGNYGDRYRDTTPSWEVPTAFNANYDGGGHTISNYRLKFIPYRLNAHYLAGLFNIVSDATISNLNLRPAKNENGNLIDGIDSSLNYYYIGLLAGEINGVCTISNCHVLSGDYTVTAYDGSSFDASETVVLGGLVGMTNAPAGKNIIFTNCTNEANLKIEKGIHKNVAGGIIGSNYGGNQYQYVDRCRNKGNITVFSDKEKAGLETFAGGIIGRISDDGDNVVFRISNCVNEGNVTAKSKAPKYACAGGIAGSHDSDGWGSVDPWVYNCLNKGDIHAECFDGMTSVTYDACAGGIFGYCYDADTKLALCVNTGRITAGGAPVIGPICGTGGTHWRCFWLVPDEFEEYAPDDFFCCYPCTGGFINGSGDNAGTPEYVRLHGKANDSESGDSLFEMTEWSREDWAAAASWTGTSDVYWNDPGHENNLDLVL